jgi:hypothetical protein
MSRPEQFDALILGRGQGGKLLAWHMAGLGRRTASAAGSAAPIPTSPASGEQLPDDPRGDADQGARTTGNIHPAPTDGTPDEAASRYERTLQATHAYRKVVVGNRPEVRLVHLRCSSGLMLSRSRQDIVFRSASAFAISTC